MVWWWRFLRRTLVIILLFLVAKAHPQRSYIDHSVLSGGKWYQLSVVNPGIYKIDLLFLQSLGISTSTIPSGAIRLYGNGGKMLPEKCNGFKTDDLAEIACFIEDGGDGILNGQDYLVFYSEGPHTWSRDSILQQYRHDQNLYSDKAFYYLTIGGEGKRVKNQNITITPNFVIDTYDDRFWHELDTINFLSSGKQWSGEEFSGSPGKTLNRSYNIPFTSIVPGSTARITTQVNARTFSIPAKFDFSLNNVPIFQAVLAPVASGPYDLFVRTHYQSESIPSPASISSLAIQFTPGSAGSQGWLDWFELEVKRPLQFSVEKQLLFRNAQQVRVGYGGKFIIQKAPESIQVWDVTQAGNPQKMTGALNGTTYEFLNDCSILREYVAFVNDGLLKPKPEGLVLNQDLHNWNRTELIIIAHSSLLTQAQRLASFHELQGIKTITVSTEQIYHEFSSGIPDPAGIRDFVKMYYDKAGTDSASRPKYLLLFGDGSFDYKARITNNTNLVPAYESSISHDPLSTYTSDDFYGFLDDADDINSNLVPLLDIGIGRLPAKNNREAESMVNKILSYSDPKAFGPWRNELTFVADDEDANLHVQDAEVISKSVEQVAPDFNVEKIYLDAFTQRSESSGSRYPEVNMAIDNKIFQGTLVWNYSGHGGYRRLAEEVILDEQLITAFNNPYRLPLFITATCDFAPFDNPLITSIGEQLLFQEKTGAIALMTTTRIVFAFSNRVMNKNYLEAAFDKKADSTYPSLGEAVKNAKNRTYRFFGDIVNNRKFTLLGDPALTLAFPKAQIKTVSINGVPVSKSDTLKAITQYAIAGEITDEKGLRLEQFTGTVYATIFDKPQRESTRGNDPSSIPEQYQVQKSMVFKGKSKVNEGKFQINFVVPKDINYQFGNGRISYYAENGITDANGLYRDFIVGGSGTGTSDQQGPEIKAFLNDENFINGGLANSRPVLILKFTDSSGINTMGTGIGHDLIAMLDNNPEKKYVLNRYYESELDDFKKGQLRFQLPEIDEGIHSITIKAWDVVNNSSVALLDFRVAKEKSFQIEQVLNYPNPFTTNTSFWFTHNRPGEELTVQVQVYTVTGRLVKTLRNTIISMGNRSNEVQWNGRDDYGNKIGRGVYIYQIKVITPNGQVASRLEKLYIL